MGQIHVRIRIERVPLPGTTKIKARLRNPRPPRTNQNLRAEKNVHLFEVRVTKIKRAQTKNDLPKTLRGSRVLDALNQPVAIAVNI